jgi:2-polyprenyl-6-hydroxyphenyl methylase/3-demethylubiquinone-9 3-methyltransferase
MKTTADPNEIANFAAMSEKWWDERGPMAPLHRFAPVRIDYILQSVRRRNQKNPPDEMAMGQAPLAGLRVLDVGCGGGILAEPMARLGADVTAIDATAEAIEAAKAHLAVGQLVVDYRCCTAEELAAERDRDKDKFDLIYASEVIEHVTDRQLFAEAIAAMLAPNGTVVITTINRTLPALAFAKVALEYVVRLVPAGTHDPKKFVKPAELRAEFGAVGIVLDDLTGFVPTLAGGFRQSGNLSINYGASGGWG